MPEVNTFLSWVQKVHPGFTPDLFTLYGWISGMLFAQGLKGAGANLTSAGASPFPETGALVQCRRAYRNFRPGWAQPASCWLLARIVNGVFVRIPPSPKAGFICNAPYYDG